MSNSVDMKEVEGFWQCDICHRQFEHDVYSLIYNIEGYSEMICEKCFNRGTIWSIREAWRYKRLTKKGDDY